MPMNILLLLIQLTGLIPLNPSVAENDIKSVRTQTMSTIELGSFEFAVQLYKSLLSDNNLVVSPFSLTSALAMTLYGSRERTGEELSRVMFGKAFALSDYNSMAAEFDSLIERVVNSNKQVLTTANFMYSHIKYPILDEFKQTLEKHFAAKSRELDFINGKPQAIAAINKDISEATNAKIPKLIDDIDPLTRLILANAVYFKGLWSSKFKPDMTKKGKFTNIDGRQVEVDMMSQKSKFPFAYSEELNAKIVELNYSNSNVVMLLLLPDEDSSIKNLESKISAQILNNVIKDLNKIKVSLSLPKFKLESNHHLVPTLMRMGAKDMFSSRDANFSGITTDPLGLYVGDIVQKAVIEVNEEGTEAAAATAVVFLSRSLELPESFVADRPFMFLLVSKYDTDKNLILFMGAVKNLAK